MSAEDPTKFIISSLLNDIAKPVLDIKNTTVNALTRYLALDYFKNDTLKNVSTFQGEVVRVVHEAEKFDWSPYNEINKTMKSHSLRYKVWVYDLDSNIIPSSIGSAKKETSAVRHVPSDDTAEGKLIIDSLPDFIVTDADMSSGLSPKDRVEVTYLDPQNFRMGVIVRKINLRSTGEAGSNNVPLTSGSAEPKKSFDNAKPSATIEQTPEQEDIKLYTTGPLPSGYKVARTDKATAVPSDGPKRLLLLAAAEDFKKMAEAAKKEKNITLVATSAYRTPEEQIKLFDERWNLPFNTGHPKRLPEYKYKQSGGLNKLKPNAAVAALPGPGPHLQGGAVDIKVGGTFNSDTYKWLEENAYKYGFFNTGANYVTKEPWHWQYIPADKGKKNAITKMPDLAESE